MALIEYKGCDTCSLKKEWPNLRSPRMSYTGPSTPPPIKALILGEGPGENEDYEGRQFVGKTGQYLRSRIPSKWQADLYWQNVVRCRPPKNRTPLPQEMSCCSTFLEEDFISIKPKAILGVGAVPFEYFWPNRPQNLSISKIRGIPFPIKLKDGYATWFMPTFHPSYVSRMERRSDNYEYVNYAEPVFRNDIRLFFELLEKKFSTPPKIFEIPKDILYPRSLIDAWSLFCQVKEPYSIDFETFMLRPYMQDALLLTCAISDGNITFAFPVEWPGDINPFGKELLVKIMQSKKRWVAQSSPMELPWIRYITKQHDHLFDDTEVLARLNHNRKGLGSLDVLTRIYLGFDVKQLNANMDKNRMREYPLQKVLKYNALDAWSTIQIYHILGSELSQKENQVDNYIRTMDTISSIVDMELEGLDLDISAAESMQKVLYKQSLEHEKKAKTIPEVREYERRESKRFSLTSTHDQQNVLVRYCKLDLEQDPETHNYSVDEEALTPFLGTHPLVDLILDSRGVEKLLSTYIDPVLSGKIIAVDGKLHSKYKAVHTYTFRLSSEDPNMQNWPVRKNKEIRRMIIPPKGYVIVKFDYAGLEVRVLCMASKDQNLMGDILDAPKNLGSKDIHWYWLYRVLEMYPQYMDRLADKTGETEEKKILDGGRTIIKTDLVFSSFYGSKANAISNKTMIPFTILQDLHEEFWGRYADVKRWVDNQFRFYQQYGYVQSLSGRIRNEVLPGNEVINTPIQGTGSEIVLEAQTALHNRAFQQDLIFLPRMNVHDDITVFLPDNNILEKNMNIVGNDMVQPRFPFVTVPLTVEPSIGYNWCDMEKLDTITGKTYGSNINNQVSA